MRKKHRVEIAARAEEDIVAITAYIARDKPGAATKWAQRIAARIRSLRHFPLRFEIIPEPIESSVPYHHHIVGNYRIIYRVELDLVQIVRVVHAAQLLRPRAFESK